MKSEILPPLKTTLYYRQLKYSPWGWFFLFLNESRSSSCADSDIATARRAVAMSESAHVRGHLNGRGCGAGAHARRPGWSAGMNADRNKSDLTEHILNEWLFEAT